MSALTSRPVRCRSSCGDTRTWTLHKHADQRHKHKHGWIKVLNNTETALFSPADYSLCLACLHWSLWVSWRAIRARQTLSGYHTEDVTWGQTRSLWIENLLRLSSLICAVVSRAAFECDSFAFEMHPALMGRRWSSVCFPPRSEPLLASIVKSQCCVFHHSSTPVCTKYENIFMHEEFAESKHKTSAWSHFLPTIFYQSTDN